MTRIKFNTEIVRAIIEIIKAVISISPSALIFYFTQAFSQQVKFASLQSILIASINGFG